MESSFGRFHFRKGFQVVPKDLQNLKNHGFTNIKQLFSEIHSGLEMVSFGHLFGPFWDHFPSHELPNGAQSAKKDPFRKHQKNYQILGAKMTPKMGSKSDLAANCYLASLFSPFWLQLASFWAPFCCLLPPFSDHLGIIFHSVLDSYPEP